LCGDSVMHDLREISFPFKTPLTLDLTPVVADDVGQKERLCRSEKIGCFTTQEENL